MKSQLLASKELITKGLADVLRLLKAGADMMGAGDVFCSDHTIDLGKQYNYECLDGLEETDLQALQISASAASRCLQQKSKPWHDLRESAAATGSTIYESIGLGTLHKMRKLFKHKKCPWFR